MLLEQLITWKEQGNTLTELRERTGLSVPRLSNLLRIANKAQPHWLRWVKEGRAQGSGPSRTTLKHIEAVLELEPGKADELLRKSMSERWPATKLRDEVSYLRFERGDRKRGKPRPDAEVDADTAKLQSDLEALLATRVRLESRPDGGGDLVIRYTCNDTLQGVLDRLGYNPDW